MMRPKTAFPRSIVALLALARLVNTSISTSPHFALISAAFSAALAKLAEDIERLQKAQDDAAFGGTHKTSYRDQVAVELVGTMKNVVRHVELHADGNIDVLKASAFELVDPSNKKWKIPDELPQVFVSLLPGEDSGTMIAMAQPIPYALKYEAHMSQGNPTIAENWNHHGFYKKPTMHLGGFTTGQDYNLRFRLICAKGPGPWSPTHTFTSH